MICEIRYFQTKQHLNDHETKTWSSRLLMFYVTIFINLQSGIQVEINYVTLHDIIFHMAPLWTIMCRTFINDCLNNKLPIPLT